MKGLMNTLRRASPPECLCDDQYLTEPLLLSLITGTTHNLPLRTAGHVILVILLISGGGPGRGRSRQRRRRFDGLAWPRVVTSPGACHDIPRRLPHAGCPGVEATDAGKSSACAGCPNQTICASGEARAPDPSEDARVPTPPTQADCVPCPERVGASAGRFAGFSPRSAGPGRRTAFRSQAHHPGAFRQGRRRQEHRVVTARVHARGDGRQRGPSRRGHHRAVQ